MTLANKLTGLPVHSPTGHVNGNWMPLVLLASEYVLLLPQLWESMGRTNLIWLWAKLQYLDNP